MTSARFPELQVLSLNELELIHGWSSQRASPADPFLGWTAPWRKESLHHYLALGWSMYRRDPYDGTTVGYILAQPILFFRKQVQSVWIEHLEGLNTAIRTELLDTVIRVAREKHMQRVLFESGLLGTDQGRGDFLRSRGGRVTDDDMIEIATTKS